MKIVLIIDFPLSQNIAGPSLRYFELALAIKDKHEVTIAGTHAEKDFIPPKGINIIKTPVFNILNLGLKIMLPNPKFIEEINQFDAILSHGRILSALGFSKIKPPLIMDLYGPWFIEDLAAEKAKTHKANMRQIKNLLFAGDFFLCASERQKDMLIGMMLMAGRWDFDSENNIGLVPIGISSSPPKQAKKTIKGILPGIAKTDKIIMWWSGIWDWLDPITPIKAMQLISQKRNDIKLIFFGIKSAEEGKTLPKMAQESIKLAKDLGLYDKNIFFLERWSPYNERADWLLEADLGIVSHNKNIETRFSWRTRAMDYLWSNIPIVTTEGDTIAELVAKHKLGRVVPYSNPPAFAHAILALLGNQAEYAEAKENIKVFTPNLHWEKLVAPINKFCDQISNHA